MNEETETIPVEEAQEQPEAATTPSAEIDSSGKSDSRPDPFAALEAAMRENDGVLALEETEVEPESTEPDATVPADDTVVVADAEPVTTTVAREEATAVTSPPALQTPTSETAATPQSPVLSEDFYPAEWGEAKHPVIEGGVGLFDARYESEDNPEAIDRIAELAEQFGGDEARAEREYAREVSAYEREKSRFETAQLQREEGEAQKAITTTLHANRIAAETNIKASYDALTPGLGDAILKEFHADAVAQVRQGIAAYAEAFQRQGLTPQRAMAKANAVLGADPLLYDDAIRLAISADPVRFAKFIQSKLTSPRQPSVASDAATPAEGAASPTPAVTPPASNPPAPSTPPRPTPPPISGSGRGAGGGTPGSNGSNTPSRIIPTTEERQMAEDLGVDPVKLARTHRELNGVR